MFDDLTRWQTILPDRVTIALVAAGDSEEIRQLAKEYGLKNVLMQGKDAEVFHAYRASATPSVVIVGADGKIREPDEVHARARGGARQTRGTRCRAA